MATEFGKRLRMAREHAGLTQTQLADLAGLAQSTIGTAEATGNGSRKTTQIATICGVSATWLATGEGPMLLVGAGTPIPAREPPATYGIERHPPSVGTKLRGTQAQVLSQQDIIVAPKLDWDSLRMHSTLPSEFYARLPDDAMAPLAPEGTVVKFRRGTAPSPGDGVLVRDQAGGVYFREFRQGVANRWTAHPTNPAYLTLDSEADRLEVVAVFCGLEGRWSRLQRL